jgi:hypothetical protein
MLFNVYKIYFPSEAGYFFLLLWVKW